MINISNKLHISTTADNAAYLARSHGLGVEIAEFCTADNMDAHFKEANIRTLENMQEIESFTFHAPFNELAPSAIDPLILEVTKKRYNQAFDIMHSYGINKMIAHSGYMPHVYYEQWFVPKSIAFWCEFLADKPDDFELYIENVLESSPDMLIKIAKEVNDKRLKLCFDAAHAAIMGPEIPATQWVKRAMPYLGHVHLHNNFGEFDTHNALGDGNIDMAELIRLIAQESPSTTFAIESIDAESSIKWLAEHTFI